MTRIRRVLPGGLAVLVALIVLSAELIPQQPGDGFGPSLGGPVVSVGFPLVIASSYAFVGGLVLRRYPRHAVGWLLAYYAVAFSFGVFLDDYAFTEGLPGRAWVATFSGVGWILAVLPLAGLAPLLFPTGRVASAGWRWFGRATATGVLLVAAANLVDPNLNADAGLHNPLGVAAAARWIGPVIGAGMALVAAGAIGGLASLIGRARRSAGVERQQVKWFCSGATVTLLSAVGVSVLYEAGRVELGIVVWGVGALTLPASIGVAILRYRLYEIDRIVSRTVAYTLVILVLAGLYAITVVALGTVARGVTGHAGGDLVVAASTLLVAAAFGPVRNRMRSAVDRRFNRARYDAARTVEAFAHHLRHEVDLDAVADELCTAVRETIEPRQVRLWLAGPQQQPTP